MNLSKNTLFFLTFCVDFYSMLIIIRNSIDIMTDLQCEHYWTPNGSYFCVHCGIDIHKKTNIPLKN